MKIERISTRLVKPHITMDGPPLVVALTNFDLQFPPIHAELLFAYKAPVPPTLALEQGLSKVLSEYREWAGRLSHDTSAGCGGIVLNDAGAVLIEAEAHGNLCDLWPFNPSHLLLDLIPFNKGVPETLLIQVTRFTCGGVTLGITSNHQVADGVAMFEFLETWASMVQGDVPIAFVAPLHDRTALMVATSDLPKQAFDHLEYKESTVRLVRASDYPNLVTKTLHFSTELLQKIKAEAGKDGVVYSTFVSLHAHIWKCITKARGFEDEEGRTKAVLSVNVRKWLDAQLPKGYFGNAVCLTCAHVKMKDLVSKPLSFAAHNVQECIKKVNNDYVRSALGFRELEHKRSVHIDPVEDYVTIFTPHFSATSWTTLPLYDLDFGWGTPMFAGPPYIHPEGLSIFAPSYKKDGSIDVVLCLSVPHMEKMESICFN